MYEREKEKEKREKIAMQKNLWRWNVVGHRGNIRPRPSQSGSVNTEELELINECGINYMIADYYNGMSTHRQIWI